MRGIGWVQNYDHWLDVVGGVCAHVCMCVCVSMCAYACACVGVVLELKGRLITTGIGSAACVSASRSHACWTCTALLVPGVTGNTWANVCVCVCEGPSALSGVQGPAMPAVAPCGCRVLG